MSLDLLTSDNFEAISTGVRPNDGLGDSPLEAAEKLNRMLAALFSGTGTVAQIIAAVQAQVAELQAQIDAGGLSAATLANTLITSGVPVDHVQGLASEILAIVADIAALDTRFTILEAL